MRYVRDASADILGSSLGGYLPPMTYSQIAKIFGPHTDEGSGDQKVSTTWRIRDTETGNVFSIYDYKETRPYGPHTAASLRKIKYPWHIGSKSEGAEDLIAWIVAQAGGPRKRPSSNVRKRQSSGRKRKSKGRKRTGRRKSRGRAR